MIIAERGNLELKVRRPLQRDGVGRGGKDE